MKIILYCYFLFLFFAFEIIGVHISFCSHPIHLASLLLGGNCIVVLQIFVNIIKID